MTTESSILSSWTDSRLRGVSTYVVDGFFSGKSVLEVGYQAPSACHKLAALGATVTVYGLAQDNLDSIKAAHPEVNTEQINLATETIRQKYDVIWDTDVLDVLADPERHIQDVCTNCDYLFLDTLVFDSSDTTFLLQHGGARPTVSWVNDALQRNGFESIVAISSAFDAESRHHAWTAQNDNECRENHCRFWIAWRSGVPSPLQ